MPIRIQSNYKWHFIRILRFHDDIPEGMLNRYLSGVGVCSFESQGKEVGWDTSDWRHSHFGGSRFEFQPRTVLKIVLSCQILVSSDEKSIWTLTTYLLYPPDIRTVFPIRVCLNNFRGMSVCTARRTFSHWSDIILHSYSLIECEIFSTISSSRTILCILCKQHSHTIDQAIRSNSNTPILCGRPLEATVIHP